MEAKLGSILKTTHWSLLLKAAVFGLSWRIFPFPIFLLVALGLYLIPLFEPGKLILPFFLTLCLSAVLVPSFWAALVLAALFFFIMGIKDLILVNRGSAYETLTFLLLFLALLNFFARFDSWDSFLALVFASVLAIVFGFLLRGAVNYSLSFPEEKDRKKTDILVSLAAFLFWQAEITLLFLPLNFFYQTALLFLATVILVEIVIDHFSGSLTRAKMLSYFSFLFAFVAVILAGNTWHI